VTRTHSKRTFIY